MQREVVSNRLWSRLLTSTLLAGAVTGFFLFEIDARGPWLRLLIAPAWMLGALVSGNTEQPRQWVVWSSLFALTFGLSYFVWRAFVPLKRPVRVSLVWRHLLVLYCVIALEVVFFHPIARALYNATGGQGDIGSGFIVFLCTTLIPGALIFVAIATAAGVLVHRRFSDYSTATLAGAWIVDGLLLIGSMAAYFSLPGAWG